MLSLHLKKSRMILGQRTLYVRHMLLGQAIYPPKTAFTVSKDKRQYIYQRAQILIHKDVNKHIANQISTVQKSIFNLNSSLRKVAQTLVPKVLLPAAQKKSENNQVAKVEQKQQKEIAAASQLSALSQPIVKTKGRSFRSSIFTLLMSLSFALIVTLFGPLIYFRFIGHEVVPVQTTDTGSVLGGDFKPSPTPTVEEPVKIQEPPYNETLPEGNWLIIPRIGVNTEILESQVPEESLLKGVWRVPEFGLPGDQEKPMILAAHRYGYNWWWKGEYWKYNSFYLLPDLEPGDVVEVISNKRKYLYEIYSGEEGTEITDYNANLILYTCKYLTSDIRHFRYARLIDPTKYPTSTPASRVKQGTATTSATPSAETK